MEECSAVDKTFIQHLKDSGNVLGKGGRKNIRIRRQGEGQEMSSPGQNTTIATRISQQLQKLLAGLGVGVHRSESAPPRLMVREFTSVLAPSRL